MKGVYLLPKVVEVAADGIDLLLQEVIGFCWPLAGVAFWTLGALDAPRALCAPDSRPAARAASGSPAFRTLPAFDHLRGLWPDVQVRQGDDCRSGLNLRFPRG